MNDEEREAEPVRITFNKPVTRDHVDAFMETVATAFPGAKFVFQGQEVQPPVAPDPSGEAKTPTLDELLDEYDKACRDVEILNTKLAYRYNLLERARNYVDRVYEQRQTARAKANHLLVAIQDTLPRVP